MIDRRFFGVVLDRKYGLFVWLWRLGFGLYWASGSVTLGLSLVVSRRQLPWIYRNGLLVSEVRGAR